MNGPKLIDEPAPSPSRLFSVGRVAQSTGISVDTLRIWERRYGSPVPVRLPSGHRRYTGEQIRWLRRVSEALARGMRPGKVLRLPQDELDDLLHQTDAPFDDEVVNAWLDLIRRFDREALLSALTEGDIELLPFLRSRICPLLSRVGRAWADGELEVRHEHFVTEVVEDVLRTRRSSRDPIPGLGEVLLATMPDEQHGLPLQMLSALCAERGVPTRNLGVDTPLVDIASAARDGVAGVAITVSLAKGGLVADRQLASLRTLLPEGMPLSVGGAGARRGRRGVKGVLYLGGLQRFVEWLDELVARGE